MLGFGSDGTPLPPDIAKGTVELAKTGDPEALGAIYDWYLPRVYRYVLARLGDITEAEDLTEDIFLRMLGAIGEYKSTRVPFSAWLFRIAHNQVVSHYRKNGFRKDEGVLDDTVVDIRHDPASIVESQIGARRGGAGRPATARSPERRDIAALRRRPLHRRNGPGPRQARRERKGATAQGAGPPAKDFADGADTTISRGINLNKQFQQRLTECLEALASGHATLADCLATYPDDAARLEPALRTAMRLSGAFAVEPRPEFASASRERFLRMSEPRLRQSLRFDPRPSFVVAARRRFLAAAQRVIANRREPRWAPAFRVAQFATAAAALVLMGFGTFAVTTSAGALPGDWRYSVKRTVEDVRYTFAFSEGAKQSLDIQYAQERMSEVQKLAERGRPIGEGPLKDMASQTDSLVIRLDNSQLHGDDAAKVEALGKQQLQVLAVAEPLVAPAASDELEQAKLVSTQVYLKAAQVVMADQENGELASNNPSETPQPTPVASPTPEATTSTGEGETPPADEGPVEPQITPIPGALVLAPIGNEYDAGVAWALAVIGRFSVEVPAQSSGWQLLGIDLDANGVAEAPTLLRVTNADSTAIVVVDTRTGDAYWLQYIDGQYQQYKVRTVNGPIVSQATQADLENFSSDNAAIVWHIINSIEIRAADANADSHAGSYGYAGEHGHIRRFRDGNARSYRLAVTSPESSKA